MKIALVQTNPTIGDFDHNLATLRERLADARARGADLAVCGELALSGYPPRDLLEEPAFIDANLDALAQLAAAAPIPAVVGFVDRDANTRARYNAAALIAEGRVQSVHHKCLLPTYDVFDELRYFAPGGAVAPATLATGDGPVALGISICEDIWNDAAFWPAPRYQRDPIAELAEAGAQLLVNVSSSPFTVRKRALRRRMLAAQANKHALPLIMVNQVGGNDDLVFEGGSCALSADGTVGARAASFAEDLLVVDVDLAAGTARGQVRPRAPETAEGDIEAALDALILGTRDYARKCGFERVLVGLSGGIDSALTAAVATDALGPGNVLGVSMPSRYSSDHSRTDARSLAESLGVEHVTVPIERIHAAALATVEPVFAGRTADATEENIQARARAIILMALSNKLGHLVLTTGNKSELAVGYCTLHGDMAGGLAVLSDVPKTMVYALAHAYNRRSAARAGRAAIPRSTLDKPPSAELRPDQTDQDSLPPYDVLDAILALHTEQRLSRREIAARGHDPAIVDRVLDLVRKNEYKRSQAAPGLKIRDIAFGPGRRMPLAARWRS